MEKRYRWILLFVILAFCVRFWLSTRYTPIGSSVGIADQIAYRDYNYELMKGGYTRGVNFILLPVMLLGRLIGLSDLTGTIAGGCLVGALSIIPLWFISEQLKINPKFVSLLYVFAPLDIAEVLTWGGYSTLFGILAINTFVALVLLGKHWLALLCLAPAAYGHSPTAMFVAVFVFSLGLLQFWRDRKVPPWLLVTCAAIVFVLIIKYPDIIASYSRGEAIDAQGGFSVGKNIRVPDPRIYASLNGPFFLFLALVGLRPFLEKNRKSLLLLLWVFLPQAMTFFPLFSNPNFNFRLLAYGAGSVCVPVYYAFENWRKGSGVWKTVLVTLLLLQMTEAVIRSVLAFSQYGI